MSLIQLYNNSYSYFNIPVNNILYKNSSSTYSSITPAEGILTFSDDGYLFVKPTTNNIIENFNENVFTVINSNLQQISFDPEYNYEEYAIISDNTLKSLKPSVLFPDLFDSSKNQILNNTAIDITSNTAIYKSEFNEATFKVKQISPEFKEKNIFKRVVYTYSNNNAINLSNGSNSVLIFNKNGNILDNQGILMYEYGEYPINQQIMLTLLFSVVYTITNIYNFKFYANNTLIAERNIVYQEYIDFANATRAIQFNLLFENNIPDNIYILSDLQIAPSELITSSSSENILVQAFITPVN